MGQDHLIDYSDSSTIKPIKNLETRCRVCNQEKTIENCESVYRNMEFSDTLDNDEWIEECIESTCSAECDAVTKLEAEILH